LGDSIPFGALPGVSAEFEQIFKSSRKAALLEGQVLGVEGFDRKSMIEQLKQKRPVVHIASHFSFRPGDEARSFLLMGDGTAFTLADMKKETNMFAGVELLTLSACNTAAQQADANGREIDGFAELAQRLGANSVMATLWPVADVSTPWLMREFYSGKLDKKLSKADSLRQAQLALLRGVGEKAPVARARNSSSPNDNVVVLTKTGKPPANAVRGVDIYVSEAEAPLYDANGKPPFAHPHYWAPFILFGNWQ
jgi:CHAT domain-containing protein